jgi:hypothetical protein
MNARSVVVVLVFALAACGHEGENLSGQTKAAPPGGTAPVADPHKGLVADPHAGVGPRVDPHAGMGTVVPPRTAGASPLAWTSPSGWKETKPSAGMRLAQFDVGVDEAGDTVQCIVFGGIGGSDDENIARWIGQMGPTAKDTAVISRSEHDGLKITRLTANGAFTDSMRPGEPKSVSAATMLAAVVEGPAGKVHVKLTGSKSVVVAAEKEFLASLKSK